MKCKPVNEHIYLAGKILYLELEGGVYFIQNNVFFNLKDMKVFSQATATHLIYLVDVYHQWNAALIWIGQVLIVFLYYAIVSLSFQIEMWILTVQNNLF